MFFWGKKKEENYYKEFGYNNFTSWLDEILKNPLPENTKGINFNLYEEENPHTYGIQFVATKSFDLDDEDWACDEIFSSGENMYFFTNKNRLLTSIFSEFQSAPCINLRYGGCNATGTPTSVLRTCPNRNR